MRINPQVTLPADQQQLVLKLTTLLSAMIQQLNGSSEGQLYAATNAQNAMPTTGKYSVGDFVKNSAVAELGTAGSKYIITGWTCVSAPNTIQETNTAFGTGDGTTTTFQVKNSSGVAVTNGVSVQAVYRNDWQGNQLLYSAPRTNLAPSSNGFGSSPWTLSGATFTPNAIAAPDGTTTMGKLVESATNANHQTQMSYTVGAGTFTASIIAKAAERNWILFTGASSSPGNTGVWFDVLGGVVGTKQANVTNATITALGGGYFRCSVTSTVTTGGTNQAIARVANANGGTSYLGDGTSGIYIYGMQMEQGSVPTSYIPTSGTTVTVTDYSATGTGAVTFSAAPRSGAALTWTGTWQTTLQFVQTRSLTGN